MTVEFRNANEFREYPFRQAKAGTAPTAAADFIYSAVVDAQFDVFCDRVRDSSETPPLVAINNIFFNSSAGTLILNIKVLFGIRDGDDEPMYDSTTNRTPIAAGTSMFISGDDWSEEDRYIYLWISFSTTIADREQPDVFPGTKAYVTGYIALNTEALAAQTGAISENFVVAEGTDEHENVIYRLREGAPVFEDSTVNYYGGQLVRKIGIATLDPIPATGTDIRYNRLIRDASEDVEEFQNDVKFKAGRNCKIETNPTTNTLTIIPAIGAGTGRACEESDPGSEEVACNDFIYSVNGIRSDSGDVQFRGVAPLQIFQGNPDFRELNQDYVKGDNFPETLDLSEQTFWEHSLIFRVGGWGDDDNLPCKYLCD